MSNMFENLKKGSHSIKHLSVNDITRLSDAFTSRVNEQLDQPHNTPITLMDYMDPNWVNLNSLVEAIKRDQIPKPFIDHLKFKDKYDLLEWIITKLFEKHHLEDLVVNTPPISKEIDFSNPAFWFPETRKMKRKIILHVGPTNSGKTYASLKQLENAKSGYYAGPLRLLAREVFEKFNSNGISCNLLTGEEVVPMVKLDGLPSLITSGTIEMIPLHKKMDLCIIDEIQMITDSFRGEAWTSALLGVQANEVHVCGEERAVDIVKYIAHLTGDELVINHYERLGKLEVEESPIRNDDLQPGDCIVTFSQRKILQLKVQIELQTKFKVAVIYGALPPEIRSEQAQGFNQGKYDILIASDAVGMGLNLAIKRIVFSTTKKFNGFEMEKLSKSSLRQIGGRAGRYSHDKNKLGGKITAFSLSDLRYIKSSMQGDLPSIKRGYIWPIQEVWINFISKYPKHKTMDTIFQDFSKVQVNSPYFCLTELEARTDIMQLIVSQGFHLKLPIEAQLKLSLAPINLRVATQRMKDAVIDFIKNIIANQSKSVMDFNFLPLDLLTQTTKSIGMDATILKLNQLEESHKLVLTFMWLSQRWPYAFVDIESAYDWKIFIEKRISDELLNLKLTKPKNK